MKHGQSILRNGKKVFYEEKMITEFQWGDEFFSRIGYVHTVLVKRGEYYIGYAWKGVIESKIANPRYL